MTTPNPFLPVPAPRAKPHYLQPLGPGGPTVVPDRAPNTYFGPLDPGSFQKMSDQMGAYFNSLDPVIPLGTPGGGLQRTLGQFKQLASSPFFGLVDAGLQGASGVAAIPDYLAASAEDALKTLTGTGYVDPRLQLQPSKEFPGPVTLQPGPGTAPSAANPLPFMGLSLDGSTSVQGPAIPKPPMLGLPPDFKPDYSKADAHYAAGKPKPQTQRTTEAQAGWDGVAAAAAQIDPYNTNWSQALGMIAGGRAEGLRHWRDTQDEMDMRAEAQQRQYELAMGGVEEGRATAEAQQHYNRLKLEQETLMQNWESQLNYAKMTSPSVQANADGSLVITERSPDGQIKVTKQGYDQVLQTELALANAKSVGGKGAEIRFENQLLQSGNYNLAFGLRLNKLIGMPGGLVESQLLPQGSPAQEAYVKDINDHRQQLGAETTSDKIFQYKDLEYRYNTLTRMLYSNQDWLNGAAKTLGITNGGAGPANPFIPPEKPTE